MQPERRSSLGIPSAWRPQKSLVRLECIRKPSKHSCWLNDLSKENSQTEMLSMFTALLWSQYTHMLFNISVHLTKRSMRKSEIILSVYPNICWLIFWPRSSSSQARHGALKARDMNRDLEDLWVCPQYPPELQFDLCSTPVKPPPHHQLLREPFWYCSFSPIEYALVALRLTKGPLPLSDHLWNQMERQNSKACI